MCVFILAAKLEFILAVIILAAKLIHPEYVKKRNNLDSQR